MVATCQEDVGHIRIAHGHAAEVHLDELGHEASHAPGHEDLVGFEALDDQLQRCFLLACLADSFTVEPDRFDQRLGVFVHGLEGLLEQPNDLVLHERGIVFPSKFLLAQKVLDDQFHIAQLHGRPCVHGERGGQHLAGALSFWPAIVL